MQESQIYKFVVLPGNHKLLPAENLTSYELRIEPQDEACHKMFSGVWGRMQAALTGFCKNLGQVDCPGWAGWDLSRWYTSKEPSDRIKYAAWVGDSVVGILNVRPGFPSHFEPEEKLLYIEHVAASPGDIATPLWERRYSSIGTALMAYAILQSVNRGFKGRVGLHAADRAAADFYSNLHGKFSLFVADPKIGVAGTEQDKRAAERPYFEVDPEAGLILLEDYRDA